MRDAYTVRTPENVSFEFELAGIAARALAWFIDVLVMTALIVVASCVFSAMTQVLGGLAMALLFIAVFLVQWWYTALLEWRWGGQTVGKRIVGLRTLRLDGVRITFFQSVVRNLVRVVDLLPGLCLVAAVSVFVDPYRRRLGDLAAGTIVVRERRSPKPSAVVPASERYNSFVNDPAVGIAARRITPPERDAMVALSLRREELPLAVRNELYADLCHHLESRLGVARPPFFSEEKFVQNLTAVVLGQSDDDHR